jgi:FkbM family methyltransferase
LHVQYAVRQLLGPGDTFYDVGANNGYLSLLGSRCAGDGGIVYAFEPMPRNARQIQRLMAENRVENCRLVETAVSNRSGTTELYLSREEDAYTPSLIRELRSVVLNVGVTTLDQFAREHRWPSLIKLDVEGAEVMVLEGAGQMLASADAPNWLIEVHSSETDQQVRKILLDHGYRIRALPAPVSRKAYPTHLMASK